MRPSLSTEWEQAACPPWPRGFHNDFASRGGGDRPDWNTSVPKLERTGSGVSRVDLGATLAARAASEGLRRRRLGDRDVEEVHRTGLELVLGSDDRDAVGGDELLDQL